MQTPGPIPSGALPAAPALRWRALPGGLGIVTAAVGVLVLLGWLLQSLGFRALHREVTVMKPNTALAFVLLGASLALGQSGKNRRRQRLAGAVVALLGVGVLLQYAIGIDLGIDQLLFIDRDAIRFPGRPSPATAAGFVFAGSALFASTLSGIRARPIAEALAAGSLLIGLVPAVGYLYGAARLYAIGRETRVAPQTALVLIAWSVGLLAGLPGGRLPTLLSSPAAGGVIARRLLPVTLAVPIAFGLATLVGHRHGLWAIEVGLGVFAAGNVVLFSGLTLWMRARLDQLDRTRRHGERVLAQREALSQHAPVGIFETDRKGHCTYVNARYCTLTGLLPEEAHGLGWVRALHPDDRERVTREWALALQAGREYTGECRYQRPDGSVVYAVATAVERHDADGQPTGYLGTVFDITERRNAEQEKQAAAQAIQRSLHEKEILLREVHHRVKNNLQVISSLLNLQMRAVSDASARGALAESRDRVHSIALVHQKLYQSQSFAEIDFSDYVDGILQNLVHAHAPAQQIAVGVAGEPVRLPLDLAVPCALIVNELVTNALKHAFPDGRVGVVDVRLAREPGGRVCLEVRDDGVGLPADLDGAAAQSLGLELVKMLADQIDAALTIERTAGTRFALRFAAPSS
jgi:PAS domain S-box-containing protein